MAVKIYLAGGAINIEGVYADIQSINPTHFDWQLDGSKYIARDGIQNQSYELGVIGAIQDENGTPYTDAPALKTALNSFVNSSGTNSVDVNLQDQVSPVIITQLARTIAETTISTEGVLNDASIEVTDASSVIIGSYIVAFNPITRRFYQGKAIAIPVGGLILLDSPLDQTLSVGNVVAIADTNIAIDGSVTPVIFQLRGDQNNPIDVTVDITRIIITMELTSSGDLSDFGNIARLTKGVLLRRVDGFVQNIFNAKSNRELKNLGYDFEFISAIGGSPDGLSTRITFAGQNKMGVALRVAPSENIQLIVQDNLAFGTPNITKFEITCEGHVVED